MSEQEYSDQDLERAIARQKTVDEWVRGHIKRALRTVALERYMRKWDKINRAAKKQERKRKQRESHYPTTQGAQVNVYLHRVKGRRGVMHKKAVYKHLRELERVKAEQFVEDTLNPRKKTIMCIIGASGTGKTLAALHLQAKCGANVVCSYTTRRPRKGEINGRDHYFTDIVPPEDTLLAYGRYGGGKYYALKTQISGPVTIYVIDERGYKDLEKRGNGQYRLYTVFIKRRPILRRVCGVSDYRMQRDEMRDYNSVKHDVVIENNGTKGEFFQKVEDIYYKLLKDSEKYGW